MIRRGERAGGKDKGVRERWFIWRTTRGPMLWGIKQQHKAAKEQAWGPRRRGWRWLGDRREED